MAMLGIAALASACAVNTNPGQTSAEPNTITNATTESGTPTLEANATVVFVVDGDTVEVDIDGVQESVRFIGIDTPEKTGGFRDAECYGDEASARMQELLGPGDEVYLELDIEARDRFDRLLAYVYRAEDALFLNHTMVLEGWAATLVFEPNTLYAESFEAAEAAARAAGIGLWGACGGPDVVLNPSS